MGIRDDWPKGRRYRVIKVDGGYPFLNGMEPYAGIGSAYKGWQQKLAVGDVITSLGYGPGWGSDPGYGIHFTTEQVQAAHVSWAEFTPHAGGVFDYHPEDGWLEEIPDSPEENAL